MATKSTALDQIRQLNQQIDKIKEQAKGEALAQAEEAIEILNSMGFQYELVEEGRAKKANGGRRSPSGACPVCKFATEPAHDARKHRSQGESKKPFAKDELEMMHLKRVD